MALFLQTEHWVGVRKSKRWFGGKNSSGVTDRECVTL